MNNIKFLFKKYFCLFYKALNKLKIKYIFKMFIYIR